MFLFFVSTRNVTVSPCLSVRLVPNALSESKTLRNGMFAVLSKAQRPVFAACRDIQGPGLCGGGFGYDNIQMVSSPGFLLHSRATPVQDRIPTFDETQ